MFEGHGMVSLKGLLVISALAVMTQPAWALNDETPASAPPNGPAASGPAPATSPTTTPTQACRKAKPPLSAEERARRKELRAQRQAANGGVERAQRTAQRDGRSAKRRLPLCPS
jgi:hypothetical protein